MIRTVVAMIALTLGVGSCAETPHSPSAKAGGSCPVTLPSRTASSGGSGFTAKGFNYGNAYLRAALYWPHGVLRAGILPDGGAMAIIHRDGSISAKLGWWRGLPHKLIIAGRRLDAPGPALRADTSDGYGARGFQPSTLTFPTVGCWRVVATLGPATLTFVVRVTKLKPTAASTSEQSSGRHTLG
jgi:hypothetical protein